MTPWEAYQKRKQEEQANGGTSDGRTGSSASTGRVQGGTSGTPSPTSVAKNPWEAYQQRKAQEQAVGTSTTSDAAQKQGAAQTDDGPTQSAPTGAVASAAAGIPENLRLRAAVDAAEKALTPKQEAYEMALQMLKQANEDTVSLDRNANILSQTQTLWEDDGQNITARRTLQLPQQTTMEQKSANERYIEAAEQERIARDSYTLAKARSDAARRAYEGTLLYHTERIDEAIERGDWAQANSYLTELTQANLSAEDRTKAAAYIDKVTDDNYLFERAAAKTDTASEAAQAAKAEILLLADRGQWEDLYSLMISEKGKEYKRLLLEEYGIDADSEESKKDNYFGLASQLEFGNLHDFELLYQSGESLKTQLASNTFRIRAQEEIQKASQSQANSAQMNDYIRSQSAYYVLSSLAGFLGVEDNGVPYNVDGATTQYLIDYLATQCGIDLSGMTEENHRPMLRRLLQEQSEKATQTRQVLQAEGFDTDVVYEYLKLAIQSGFEQARQDSFQEWSQNTGTGEKILTDVLMIPYRTAVEPFVSLSEMAALVGENASTDDPNSYVPMLGTTSASDMVRSAATEALEKNTDWKLFGKNVASFLYSAGMSAADSAANAVAYGKFAILAMGTRAASAEANDILARGGSREQAFCGGVAAGVIEAATEYFSIDKLLSSAGSADSLKALIKAASSQAFTEGTEEMSAEMLNIIVDSANMGNLSRNSQAVQAYMDDGMSYDEARKQVLYDNIGQVAEAGALGFVSGGISGSVKAGAAYVSNYAALNRMGEWLKADTLSMEDMRAFVDTGLESATDTRSYELAIQMQKKLDAGSKLTKRELARLYQANVDAINAERASMQSKEVNGQKETGTLQLVNAQKSPVETPEASSASVPVSDSIPQSAQGVHGGNIAMNDPLMELAMRTAREQNGLDAVPVQSTSGDSSKRTVQEPAQVSLGNKLKTVMQNGFEVSEDGKAKLGEKDVAIKGVARIETGNGRNTPYLVVVDAEGNESTVRSEDVTYGSSEEGILYESFAQFDVDPMHFTDYMENFKLQKSMNGMSAEEYALLYDDGVFYGRINSEHDLAQLPLQAAAKQAAFAAGRDAENLITKKAQAERERKVAERKESGKGKLREKGKLHGPEKLPKKRNALQNAGIGYAKRLAELGFEVHIYQSHQNAEGEWVDENGEIADNGYYLAEDGSIHIDLNAGNHGQGIMIYTLAHELTHALERNAPQKYKLFAELLVKWYGEQGESVGALVKARMAEQNISREEAFHEVVARSCESFLTDSDIMHRITELKAKSAELWATIRETVLKFLNWARSLYKDIDPESEEGWLLHDARGTIDHLYDAFYNAFEETVETVQWIGVQKNTADEGGVQYQLRQYTQTQINNWSSSKKIVIYNSDSQLLNFVNDALAGINLTQKMYFGEIDDVLAARISKETGIDVNGRNVTLRAGNVRKIVLHSHGNQNKESLRGQRAVVADDFLRIRDVIGNPSNIEKGMYENRDAIIFEKYYGNERFVVFAVDSGKSSLDLFVQTLYVNVKKGSVTNVTNAQTLALTSKTTVGTAPTSTIAQTGKNSNTQKTGNSEKQRSARSQDVDAAYLDAVESGDMETAQRMVDEAAKKAGYTIHAYHGTTNRQEKSSWNANTRSWDTEYSRITVFKRQYPEQAGHFFNSDMDNAGGYGSDLYSVYLMLKKPLVIDCKGQNYASIAHDGKEMDTYEWADYARKQRHDGVIFENISDGVGYDDLSRLTTDYVVFDSNRIKSADPVTYDDNGNVIPLSERFNVLQRDIRYSKRGGTSERDMLSMSHAELRRRVAEVEAQLAQAQERNKTLTAQKEHAKAQLHRTDGTKVDPTGVFDFVRKLMKRYENPTLGNELVRQKTEELLKIFNKAAEINDTLDFDSAAVYLYYACNEFSSDIVAEGLTYAEGSKENTLWEMYPELRKTLRETKLLLPKSLAHDVSQDFADWRKRYMGRLDVKLVDDGQGNIDSFYHDEIMPQFPELFDGEIYSEADMLLRIAEVSDRIYESRNAEVPYSRAFGPEIRERMVEAITNDILNEFARVNQNPRVKTAMDKLIERHEKEMKGQKAAHEAYRKEAKAKQEKLIAEYQKARAKSVEGRKKTAVKGKIRRRIHELNSLYAHGNKKRNVKEGMRDTAASLLASADVLFSADAQIPAQELARNGVQTELTEAESKALNEYIDRLGRKNGVLEKLEVLGNSGKADAATLKGYEKMVAYEDRKLTELETTLAPVFERERARLNKATFGGVMDALAASYKKLEVSEDDYIKRAFDPYVHTRLTALTEEVGGTAVKEMSLTQLTALYDAVNMVVTTIKNANKLFVKGKAQDIREYSRGVANEIKQVVSNAKDSRIETLDPLRSFAWDELKPVYAFRYIGSEKLERLYWDAVAAEGVYARDIEEAKNFISEQRKKYGYTEWDRSTRKDFDMGDGRVFSLDVEQMMSIYAYSRREQAFDHMMRGGFVLNPRDSYKDKKLGFAKVINQSEPFRVDLPLLSRIIETLTPEQRAYAETMQTYLSQMGEKGNEVSRKMYGIDLFKEKFYFPLQSSHDFLNTAQTELQKTQTTASLKNTGMAKETVPHASNPIILSRFDDVWMEHVNKMSSYHAFVVPIDNLSKVLNFTDGKENLSMMMTLRSAFGDASAEYLKTYIQDLNGGALGGRPSGMMSLFGKFKKTAVGASLSTAIQQPTAILRAMAYIRPDYFVPLWRGKMAKTTEITKLYEELRQYAPITIIKEMGGFDVGSGRQAKDYMGVAEYEGFRNKFKGYFSDKTYRSKATDDAFMYLASKGDVLGWTAIWSAVKKEVASEGGRAEGTEAYLKRCGERFTEVIVLTQVYDSVNSRSGIMRSKNELNKFATSFMGEPTTSLNMCIDAIVQAKRGKGKANAVRKIAAVVISTVATGAAASVIYANRDDEDDEAWAEKWAEQFGAKLRSDLNPMNMIPYLRDVVSLLDGWDVERPDMAIISDLISSFDKLDSDKATTWQKIESFTGSFAAVFGVPLKNLLKDARGIYNAYEALTDEVEPHDVGGAFWRGFTGEELTKSEKLYDALIRNDSGRIAVLREDYEDESAYTSAVRSALREHDPRVHEGALSRLDGDITGYTRVVMEILTEGHFSQDDIVAAIESEMTSIENELEDDVSEPRKPNLYNAEDYMSAILDEPETAEEVKSYIMQRYVDKGKTQAEAQSEFYSDVCSEIGDLYKHDGLSYDTAMKYLTSYGGKSENDAYWQLEKWNYAMEHGSTEGYSKYGDFYVAVQTGKDLQKTIRLYVSKGVKTETLVSQITSYFKPIYISMSKQERAKLKNYLLSAYACLGEDRAERSKLIDKWLTSEN